jgi:two-component system chemotaxis response regulator CheY
MKLLVVDDSATMRRIVTNSLQRIGYQSVIDAEDGAAALRKLDEGSVDFVITDWVMPAMTGLELTKQIRAGAHAHVPILMVTARSVREDILDALSAGVDNYIVKPFTPQMLREKIDAVIGKTESV